MGAGKGGATRPRLRLGDDMYAEIPRIVFEAREGRSYAPAHPGTPNPGTPNRD